MLTILGRSIQASEPRDPDRPPRVAPEVLSGAQAERDTTRSDHERSRDGGPSR